MPGNYYNPSCGPGRRHAAGPPFLLGAIIALAVAAYYNTLFNGFVFDDVSQIVRNHWIKDVGYLPDIFSSDVWEFFGDRDSNFYRPLMHVIFMVEYHVFGLSPWGFHLVAVLFHAGNSVLVFLIVRRLSSGAQTAPNLSIPFVAAVLFATHPIHTEAVAWVSAMPDLSCAFFYLLSFYLYVGARSMLGARYISSIVSFFLAALCKEPGLTLPIVLAAHDYVFLEGKDRRLLRYVPFLAAGGGYLALRYLALGGLVPLDKSQEVGAYQYLINVFPLFSRYLGKLLLPLNLNAFYVFHPVTSVLGTKAILSFAVTVAFSVVAFAAYKRSKVAFFGLLLMVVPLAPALYIPGVGSSGNVFSERYLYLPSLGFVLLMSLLIDRMRANLPRTVGIGMVVLLAGFYTMGTVSRNMVWKDDYTLFSDTVRKSPDAYLPHGNLGAALMGRGHLEEAIERFQTAIRLNPNYANARYNLGVAHGKKGLFDKAIEQYRIAIRLNPDYADAYYALGAAYADKGLPDRAIEQYLTAIRLKPNYADAYNSLGVAYADKGFLDRAIGQYLTAIRLKPDYADAYNNLGAAYANKGLIDEALGSVKKAVRLNPSVTLYWDNLLSLYEMKMLAVKAGRQ